jgi:hypothetical protein
LAQFFPHPSGYKILIKVAALVWGIVAPLG